MDILCIDIGGGTQDICCFNGKDTFENSFKMVMPTPAKRLAEQIRNINGDIFINGTIIGGGILGALKEKIKLGYSVFMSQKSACSVRDNLQDVRNLGIIVVEEVLNPNIILKEFDSDIIIPSADKALNGFNPEIISVAVQDHGFLPDKSDRVTRFEFLKEFIKNGLKNAFFDDFNKIPPYMTRFRAIYEDIKEKYSESRICVTDTAVAACLGASINAESGKPFITIDIGNCHTFAGSFDENGNILGFFEHHTYSLSNKSLIEYIDMLSTATINHEKIFNEEGHGAYLFSKRNIEGCKVYVTGPNREKYLQENNRFIFTNPKGDNMMTGPVGMLIQQDIEL